MLQFASVMLIVTAIWRARSQPTPWDRPMILVMLGIGVIAIAQLIHVPPALWQSLPGRAELIRQMTAAGVPVAGWRSISLDPVASERSLFWVLPGIAMYLCGCAMTVEERTRLVLVVFAVAFASLIVGVGQIAGGSEGILRFYGYGRTSMAVGFFSNRNHLACMLAMTIPLAFALLVTALHRRAAGRSVPVPWLLFLGLTVTSLLITLPVNGSRAAVILGGLAILGSFAMLLRANLARRVMLALIGVGVLAIVLTVQFGIDRVLDRLQRDPADDARWTIHATTLDAAHHFGPLGSGLGTFVSAYQAVAPERDLGPLYINFAHSDYHQLWLETGIPGVVVIVVFVLWFGWRGTQAWTMRTRPHAALILGWAASISILVVLAHSWVDYPLRKTATIALLGLCCALLSTARVPPPSEPQGNRRRRRSRTHGSQSSQHRDSASDASPSAESSRLASSLDAIPTAGTLN
ncbi:MAG: O-antigen ligase family protein [Lysobacteraceae bacterium]